MPSLVCAAITEVLNLLGSLFNKEGRLNALAELLCFGVTLALWMISLGMNGSGVDGGCLRAMPPG
jgi:hypothetical protein